ncbi:FAD-dependent oxidoreductase [Pseudomonas oryzae]|uniref:Succinate dehydrogenase/fumarate reductase, flavoprotein subunit n=1 Tax=Pseudomonas oryzae TaxID=1392877 RepID=A0A1H1PTG2_9PSED|nr:FAD-dependent oxidoreductase [Pseudomonas oryzae]SDS14414.1 Succinate dehydrogenase/fumarate reductase, flavoprotein subunit [Pseudomonas oryzae]
MQTPDRIECDVLVIGSGAAGLAAAVTAAHHGLKVVVAEKEPLLGGTSAWSGGWLWIPRNPLAVADGQLEEPGAPERYLREQLHRAELDERQRAFLDHGPAMVEFFQRHTAVQFQSGSRMPDMHDGPGAVLGGRSLCAQPFDGRQLGEWIAKLRPPLDLISLAGMGIAGGADLAHFLDATRSPRSALYAAGRLLRHFRDRLLHGRGLHLVNGNALVARLLRSALDLRVSLLTEAPVRRLLDSDGRVIGALLDQLGTPTEIHARRGVVLACGGFPHDRARIAQLFPHAPDGKGHHSAAPPCNTGDGLRLAEAVGGLVANDLAHAGAWAPVSLVPLGDGSLGAFPHLMERAKPGFVIVRRDGRRFVNEADSYHVFMNALFATTPAGEEPVAWLIGDHRARNRYGIGAVRPFPFPEGRWLRNDYLKRGDSLEDLARQCGIAPTQLAASVARFNRHAACGADPDFGRGASPYNRAQGEARHGPNPSLGELAQGPFYAVKLVPGSLGTFAGLRTDATARVLDGGGQPIAGLFAVGNDMASVMDGHYPSGGITLGPGMTFGYLAALELAGQSPFSGDKQPAAIAKLDSGQNVLTS